MLRKSLAKDVSDSYFQSTSSPLRRSIITQKIIPQVLEDNDDEAERVSIRHKSVVSSTASSSPPTDKRRSLGLSCLSQIPESQMKEHISHCIKLNTENKINMKNAFSLEMIDFMTFMVTQQKSENINLQLASTSLDVMTKIYVYRVDGLYSTVLKMAGALDNQLKKHDATSNGQENEEMPSQVQAKKRKMRKKQDIISTESALKRDAETSYPSQSYIGSGDLYASDMLYQVVLPNHASSGFYHHPYNDVILDVLDETRAKNKNSSKYIIPPIEDCSKLDICSSFSECNFLNWPSENEQQDPQLTQEYEESRFRFDLDATPVEDHESEATNYFNTCQDTMENHQMMRKAQQVETIVDFRDILTQQISGLEKQSEYSFINKSCIHWAGPSYWKVKQISKPLQNPKEKKTCHQMVVRDKNTIVLNYNDNIISTIEQEFLPGQAIRIQAATARTNWKGENITLPEDIHYDVLQKAYFYPSMIINFNNQLNATKLSEDNSYDCSNENNMAEHCPIIDTHCQVTEETNAFDELGTGHRNAAESQLALTGNNLVAAPKLTQKTFLQYALRAKKIDMRQLKKAIWNSLTLDSNEERMDIENEAQSESIHETNKSHHFSKVYKSLPNALSKTNAEALSVPIAFVSLLHLANEKSLKLSSLPNFSDVIVERD